MDIKSLILKNIKSIFYVITWGILVYVILFGTNRKDDELYKEKIDTIQATINQLNENQKKFNTEILRFKNQMVDVENKISEVENQKIIIKEIYHEKINNVNNYSDKQLDSFFTERYGYFTH
jgi:peptidoglycan hydrolase CwlO-like protein